jgi:hypothetical protein
MELSLGFLSKVEMRSLALLDDGSKIAFSDGARQ